jgi:hypothetical protein
MIPMAPPIELTTGLQYDVVFDAFTPRITFLSDTQLKVEIVSGVDNGMTEVVNYSKAELRPGLFSLSWQEKSKLTVVHVEDFRASTSHAYVTLPDGTFLHLTGSIIVLP